MRSGLGLSFGSENLRLLASPNQSSARNFDDTVFAGRAIHAFAHPGFSGVGNQTRIIELRYQVIEVVVGFQDYVPAASPIAAAGAALGDKGFPMKSHAAFAAVTGSGKDLYFVNKHNKKGEVIDLASAKCSRAR